MPCTEPASPVELPPHRPEPLRRSHSAASIHSLPTPPRTRKRKRSRSTHSRAADSDSEIDERAAGNASEEEEDVLWHKAEIKGAVQVGSKRRKLLQVDKIAAELSGRAAEDEFWTSSYNTLAGKVKDKSKADTKPDTATSSRLRSESPERSLSASPPSRLLKRNRTGLLSPPQSKRRSSPRVKRFAVPPLILEEPSEEPEDAPRTPTRLRTPPRKSKPAPVPPAPKKGGPERDTPNNPFLDSDGSSFGAETPDAEGVVAGPSSESSAPKPRVIEKPTITYVFRGVRTEFINPLYDPKYPETGVAPERDDAPSKLPPEHVDFEPDEHVLPTKLFATDKKSGRRRRHVMPPSEADEKPPAKKARAKGKQPAPKQKSEWDTSDEEDNTETKEQPDELTLPRTPSLRRSPRLARPQAEGKERAEIFNLTREVHTTPRLPEKDRSDPAKRAFGVHDMPPPPPKARAPEPDLVVKVDEVREVRRETRVKVTPPTPRLESEVEEVHEVRETTHVKVASSLPSRAVAPQTKPKTPPEAAVVPVEDVDENPFL
ncbi:uncharacterized protein PHACADRAFT_254178 [Phanerochaete carnosa HHB-10118-sp]|uniref:Uncharacterized protein n=1 Tax=Phanerochaete carnosa (strain HHB-10118-sp) TaxID=650164 RepID=K5WCA4_PHACS|nr:uncharacterized protein PHACADRAFT_254178 [Phanerochaete carnosa HHB-10118-sp]EKM56840.1 hypothetical protein PHACADRAFT_254178 [Phanerochaete carnosa HHB-10118-sp]